MRMSNGEDVLMDLVTHLLCNTHDSGQDAQIFGLIMIPYVNGTSVAACTQYPSTEIRSRGKNSMASSEGSSNFVEVV